jgi:outer membrane cobalamin receptor
VIRDLGDGTFVLYPANLGSARNLGLELSANGKIGTALSYNVSANLADTRITARNLGFAQARTVRAVSGKGSLDWQAGPDDLLQINVNLAGRRPAPQGYLKPGSTVNLGWRHKLSPRASLTATAQDVLATQTFKSVLDTATFQDIRLFDPVSRTFSLRLDYRFGGGAGKAPPEPKIEYDGGAPAP